MRYMAFDDSEVLRELARIMEENDTITKVAQVVVAPLTEDEKGKLNLFVEGLQKMPSNGPGMERWIARLKGQVDPGLKAVYDALVARHALWAQGKSSDELAQIPLPGPDSKYVAKPLEPSPFAGSASPAITPKGASVKTAEEKLYDVGVKEDIVQKAHPKPAYVAGDLVENLNEQQKADVAVAQKSAKNVLVALHKLAKKLDAEDNQKAAKLVKDAALEIARDLKKLSK